MPTFDSNREKLAALDAQVVDISVDSILSHEAWQKKEIGMVKLPLCSDFFPHGEVTQKFGVLREGPPVPGICERAAFIVDKNGKIAFAKTYPLDQLPNIEELLDKLKQIQYDKLKLTQTHESESIESDITQNYELKSTQIDKSESSQADKSVSN